MFLEHVSLHLSLPQESFPALDARQGYVSRRVVVKKMIADPGERRETFFTVLQSGETCTVAADKHVLPWQQGDDIISILSNNIH